ncbi:MAG: sigma-70 region 4 domain-containing protein, partial [Anaerolineaceae bacterium]|nr:sigma-70 region 4 domain-containing protein [Anaerolineaceae bacterium]
IEIGDDHSQITRLLAMLDDHKQELLRLRFAAGLSFAEIATLEDRSEAAVKMAIYRALDWLRNQWEADNE